MAEYKIEVTTGEVRHAGTFDHIHVTLVATGGESERTELDNAGRDFKAGKTGTYILKASRPLGRPLLVKVEKDRYLHNLENEWFCSKIAVTTPEGDVVLFPCHRWVSRGELVELRGGRAMKAFEDEHPRLIDHRKKELALHKQLYQWSTFADGVPHVSSFTDDSEMPAEIRVSASKASEFAHTEHNSHTELRLKRLNNSIKQWESIEAMKKVFWFKRTPISEYVSEHWKEDAFYGYQFLNATNPSVIQRCSKLPHNFPVTEAMVQPSLHGRSLGMEMEKGNIFLCDYKMMEGLPTRVVNDEPVPLTAGMCLFYMNPERKLLPVAIQLNQQPSAHNPIFLPSDPENDWLLAKMFLKHADTLQWQTVSRLMNTHFLADVFTVATLRSFPVIHPLYKLLIPHFRYTLQVNTDVRQRLLSPGGVLTGGSLGAEGLTELMRRALSETTYSALCLPDNITARGLETVPNFYYREDGLRLWDIINGFVRALVEFYYPSDREVQRDCELQEWIREIFTHGFLGNKRSGIPECFHTGGEVAKFVTMVIFTVSAQHAAVNNGQFDYNSWLPNNPPLLCKAPPTTKGRSSVETILETLPDVGTTVQFMTTGWLLSKKYEDFIPLGTYPDEHFDEPDPKQMIKEFQAELSYLSEDIAQRNSELEVPYNYLNPMQIENSVSI